MKRSDIILHHYTLWIIWRTLSIQDSSWCDLLFHWPSKEMTEGCTRWMINISFQSYESSKWKLSAKNRRVRTKFSKTSNWWTFYETVHHHCCIWQKLRRSKITFLRVQSKLSLLVCCSLVNFLLHLRFNGKNKQWEDWRELSLKRRWKWEDNCVAIEINHQ